MRRPPTPALRCRAVCVLQRAPLCSSLRRSSSSPKRWPTARATCGAVWSCAEGALAPGVAAAAACRLPARLLAVPPACSCLPAHTLARTACRLACSPRPCENVPAEPPRLLRSGCAGSSGSRTSSSSRRAAVAAVAAAMCLALLAIDRRGLAWWRCERRWLHVSTVAEIKDWGPAQLLPVHLSASSSPRGGCPCLPIFHPHHRQHAGSLRPSGGHLLISCAAWGGTTAVRRRARPLHAPHAALLLPAVLRAPFPDTRSCVTWAPPSPRCSTPGTSGCCARHAA